MNLRARFALLVAALAAWSFATSAQAANFTVSIIPASPRYMEPVYVRITPDSGTGQQIDGARVSMSGTTISVQYEFGIEIGEYSYDVMLGRFPQGTFNLTVSSPFASNSVETQFTVGAPPPSQPGRVPAVNFTDLWWDPAESGWGMSINQGPANDVFAVWFTYDAAGNPAWYTLQPGSWVQATVFSTYTGPIYRTTGPYFGGPFDPSRVTETPAGTGTLSFRDSSHGEFRYTIGGISGAKQIERMPIE